LIAASNQSLEEMLEKGTFRKDLFYRLNVIRLHIPPLRERREDIIELSRHLLELLTRDANLPMPVIDAEARRALIDYDWPGNVRELSNALERSLASMAGGMIRLTDLPFHIYQKGREHRGARPASIREVQHQAEKEAIQYALKVCGYNKSRAARHLGIHRTLLYKKMKRYRILLEPAR
jgi:transcriptional regulator with PAS, ATPase and Fis domain